VALRIACALLGFLGGGGLALVLTNRWIFNFKESPPRTIVHAGLVLVLTLGPAATGYRWPSAIQLGAWLALLGLLAAGEARRILLRRRLSASGPIERTRPPAGPGWRALVSTDQLACARYALAVPGLAVPRLRIAHASDFHVPAHGADAYFAQVMATLAASAPDLLVLTGDFISHTRALPRLREVLREARGIARLGAFAVLGNHDHWSDADAVTEVLREAGITRLHEHAATLAPHPGAAPVHLCGDERPWGPGPRWPDGGGVTIVLSHTPDNIYRLARQGAHVVLSGHNHAGQIRVPGLGAIVVPSRYGRRFDHGHFQVGHTHLFVSAGVGTGSPPFRLHCPPDVFVIDLRG
jgi:predicted MPP superfamily phosphohydrolase